MNKIWLAACFAFGILIKNFGRDGYPQTILTPTNCYADGSGDDQYQNNESIESMLDDNWDWYELDNWWFFPKSNLAIRKNPSKYEERNGTRQYLVSNITFRAMNQTVDILPYQLAVSGKTDRFKRRSSSRRYEHLAFYAKLNDLNLKKDVLGGKDLITVSSSRNIRITRKVPFPVGEVPIAAGIYSIPTDSGMVYKHKMHYYYDKDVLFLHPQTAGDDSAHFHYIKGKDYFWDEFKPYKGYKGSSSQRENEGK